MLCSVVQFVMLLTSILFSISSRKQKQRYMDYVILLNRGKVSSYSQFDPESDGKKSERKWNRRWFKLRSDDDDAK
jgi:hypothetical protein